METWKEFEANELTHSGAHHLLAIHEVGQHYGGWARVSDVARHLDITRGSVSVTLRALKKRGLVLTDEHHLVSLSPEALHIVHGVMAKKAAVKAFLVEVLGVSEQQAEIDSCKVEHLLSRSTGEKLLHFIRFLMSEEELAARLKKTFRGYPASCSDVEACPLCDGHCLMEELEVAS